MTSLVIIWDLGLTRPAPQQYTLPVIVNTCVWVQLQGGQLWLPTTTFVMIIVVQTTTNCVGLGQAYLLTLES